MKVINCVYDHNKKKYLIMTAALAVIGATLIFTQYFGAITLANEKALDMLFNYDKTTFYEILHLLTESDRLAYKLIHLADYIFILGLYPITAMALSRNIRIESKFKVFVILPLMAGLFDFLENLMMDIHLYAYPNEIIFMGSISGIFTTLKFTLLYASVVLLLVFWVLKLVNKAKNTN